MIQELKRLLEDELAEGEQLLWQGQPNPRVLFNKVDIYMIPASLFMIAFIILFFIPIGRNNQIGFLTIFFIIFLTYALYMAIGRFVYKVSLKKRTLYVLTDKRVIEISKGFTIKKRTLTYSQITKLKCKFRRSQNGSITFGDRSSTDVFSWFYQNTGMEPLAMGNAARGPAFYDVDNADVPSAIIKERMQSYQQNTN